MREGKIQTWSAISAAFALAVGLPGVLGHSTARWSGRQAAQRLSCDSTQPHQPLITLAKNRTTYVTTPGSFDRRILYVATPTGLVRGPEAMIWPARGSNDRTDQEPRIMARIWIDPSYGGGQGYPKLSLPRDTSWILICGVGSNMALVIPENPALGLRARNVRINFERPWPSSPQARWEFHPTDDHGCIGCPWGWCEVE